MIVLFLLIPMSVIIAAIFLGVFVWAVRSGQFEDTCTPALRMLVEETAKAPPTSENPTNSAQPIFAKPMAKNVKPFKTP